MRSRPAATARGHLPEPTAIRVGQKHPDCFTCREPVEWIRAALGGYWRHRRRNAK